MKMRFLSKCLFLNFFQQPIIGKIRALVKSQTDQQSSKSSDDDEKVSEEDLIESLGLKDVARTSNGKIDHAKLPIKDRMALVRGMRKRKNKNLKNGTTAKKRSPSPENSSEQQSPGGGATDASGDENAQYRAHISETTKFEVKPPKLRNHDETTMNGVLASRRPETVLKTCSKLQFLTNLNLFEPTEVDQILNILDEDAKQKIDFRNMTYIPEISDKKHKISYTYLAPDIQSPPLLRTRQRNSANPSRMTSRSNSRATTPDRSLISRQMSNDSESSSKRSTDNERASLENELQDLQKRSDELKSLLSSKKQRTVSTRVSFLKASMICNFLQKRQLCSLAERTKPSFRGQRRGWSTGSKD